jgi:hypothetical protein
LLDARHHFCSDRGGNAAPRGDLGTLVLRLASLELGGEVRTSQSVFGGGPKTLPFRSTLR